MNSYKSWLNKLRKGCLALAAGVALLAGLPTAADADAPPRIVDYMLVVTGGELLAGAYPDAHTAYITRTLHPLGFRCVAAVIVDDAIEEIQQAVRDALARVPIVIVTGGLGPTPDDVTREALSELTGIPLREEPALLERLARRFNTPLDQLRANLRRQTEVPVQGGYLENPHGTAVGLLFEQEEGLIVALPGPPRELQPMVREVLVPLLTERLGTRAPGDLLQLRFVGIGESSIAHTIDQHITIPEEVTVASLFEGMRVDFYFTLPGATPEDAAQLARVRDDLLEHLGEYVYAVDDSTLEEHVVDLLAEQGKTLALAEAGSGGSLTAAVGGSRAIDQVLIGAYVAPDELRLEQLLGGPRPDASDAEAEEAVSARAAALAERLAELTGADLAVVTVAATADDGSSRFVEAAFRHADQAASQRLALRGSGEFARFQLKTQLLDLIRRRLQPDGPRPQLP